MVITIQFRPQWTESSERRSSAYSVDRNGSKLAFTDNDDHCSVFFHDDLFDRNNSRSAKSFAVQAPELVDIRRQGAIQRLEDITIQVEDQTINRRAENRVHPQPQEHDEWNS